MADDLVEEKGEMSILSLHFYKHFITQGSPKLQNIVFSSLTSGVKSNSVGWSFICGFKTPTICPSRNNVQFILDNPQTSDQKINQLDIQYVYCITSAVNHNQNPKV